MKSSLKDQLSTKNNEYPQIVLEQGESLENNFLSTAQELLLEKIASATLNVYHKELQNHDCINDQNIVLDTNCLYIVAFNFLESKTMAALNQQYRNKNDTTNVLSFSASQADQLPYHDQGSCYFLGDLAFCKTVIFKEAKVQQKSFEDHLCHLFCHGILHLLGMDHESNEQADKMENFEILALSQLNIKNPYENKAQ